MLRQVRCWITSNGFIMIKNGFQNEVSEYPEKENMAPKKMQTILT